MPDPLTAPKRVIVKFDDKLAIPRGENGDLLDRERWVGQTLARLPWRHLFQNVSDQQLQPLITRAQANDPTYQPPNFRAYFVSIIPGELNMTEVVNTLQSRKEVEVAYVESGPAAPPSFVTPSDDPLAKYQGYLKPADEGIDAYFAWDVEGGDGAGIGFVDLEQGWALNHRDLVAHGITLISGVSIHYKPHGTGVLGVVTSVDNNYECVGIAPNLDSVRCVSQWRASGVGSTAEAILDAAVVMKTGDVLLLEAQTESLMPVEIERAVFDEIELATTAGISVVECAGNGSSDLNTATDSGGKQVLNPGSADFRDSGAVFVGAGVSTTPHSRASWSNYGDRVDCYAWGDNITTLATNPSGTNLQQFTYWFGGTSGAAAIVAGAAISVQGAANAHLSAPYQPAPLRDLLRDPTWNTASANASDKIGVMPNLRGIITEMKILRR